MIIGGPRRRREKGAENISEDITAENFPHLGKETDIQVQEAQRVSDGINPKRVTPRHIVIKMAKIKENIKSSKGKATSYLQGNSHEANS